MTTQPDASNDTQSGATNLVEPLDELLADVTLLVHGTVVSIDPDLSAETGDTYPAQTATIRVNETLRGAAADEITVRKPTTMYYLSTDSDHAAARSTGYFMLAEVDGDATLIGYRGVYHDDNRREIERALADLPAEEPQMSPDEIRELATAADSVVVADATPVGDASSSRRAVLTVSDVLVGAEVSDELEVVRVDLPEQPGGNWLFAPRRQLGSVFFLDLDTSPATVLNPVDPATLFRFRVETLLR